MVYVRGARTRTPGRSGGCGSAGGPGPRGCGGRAGGTRGARRRVARRPSARSDCGFACSASAGPRLRTDAATRCQCGASCSRTAASCFPGPASCVRGSAHRFSFRHSCEITGRACPPDRDCTCPTNGCRTRTFGTGAGGPTDLHAAPCDRPGRRLGGSAARAASQCSSDAQAVRGEDRGGIRSSRWHRPARLLDLVRSRAGWVSGRGVGRAVAAGGDGPDTGTDASPRGRFARGAAVVRATARVRRRAGHHPVEPAVRSGDSVRRHRALARAGGSAADFGIRYDAQASRPREPRPGVGQYYGCKATRPRTSRSRARPASRTSR